MQAISSILSVLCSSYESEHCCDKSQHKISAAHRLSEACGLQSRENSIDSRQQEISVILSKRTVVPSFFEGIYPAFRGKSADVSAAHPIIMVYRTGLSEMWVMAQE